ncbi:MAG: YdcF family protein [Oscillospiraceae bacterium]|nr:YdcF family protein [Oscillospiraceae bacterium]
MAWAWVLGIASVCGVAVLTVTGIIILRAGSPAPTDCPWIIVLGAQVNADGPSEALEERIDAAYHYLQAHPATQAVLTGGKGDNEHIAEAECMFQKLTAMGIAPERLRREDKAVSTWTNLVYSLAILQQETGSRPEQVGIVTHDFHLFRATMHATAQGLKAYGISAKSRSKLHWLYYFLREIAGVWHYLILGGTYHD